MPHKVNEMHRGIYATLVALSCENTDDLGVETFEPNQEGNVDDSVTKETIERDLTRTFLRHDMFMIRMIMMMMIRMMILQMGLLISLVRVGVLILSRRLLLVKKRKL